MNDEIQGLVRRGDAGLRRFVSNTGLAGPARVEPGRLPVNGQSLALHANKVAVGSMVIGWSAFIVDAVGSTNALAPLEEAATVGIVGSVSASLVVSAPTTPRHANNPLPLHSQTVRRVMLASAGVGAAANLTLAYAGVGGPHTAIGLAALAVGVTGYVAGL